MTFYQLRISIIPFLLLSTGLGIVTWLARLGLERRRTDCLVAVGRAVEARHLDRRTARERLLECASEADLLKWLDYPTLRVRRSAIRGLGLIGTTRSVPALTELLNHRSPSVRRLAEAAIRQARRRSGNPELDALLDRADRLGARGETRQALETLERGLLLHPDHPETYFRCGSVLLDLGDLGAAETAFSKAIELDPAHFDAYLERGICYLRRSRFRKARADCLRAVEINPNMEEVRLLMDRAPRVR